MKEILPKNLKDITLPKWTTMLIKGNTITKEQAMEVLVRTNDWGDFEHSEKEIEELYIAIEKYFINFLPPEEQISGFNFYENKDLFFSTLKILDFSNIHNTKIHSKRGWLDWNGKIFSNNYNLGKWPSALYVYEDIKNLVNNFNFIKYLDVQLVEELEGGESIILLNIKYDNGYFFIYKDQKNFICDFKHYLHRKNVLDNYALKANSEKHKKRVFKALTYVFEKYN